MNDAHFERTTERKVVLRGYDAINYAGEHGLNVNRSQQESSLDAQQLSVEQALQVVDQNPALIWIEIEAGVNSAD